MDSIFVAPDPISPRSLNVVGEDGAMEMVGIIPLGLIPPVLVKGVATVIVTGTATVTGITTITVFTPPSPIPI